MRYDVHTRAAIGAALVDLEGAPDTPATRNRRAVLQAAAWRASTRDAITRQRQERRALYLARTLAVVLMFGGAAIIGATIGAALATL